MSESKALKAREYGTDILNHQSGTEQGNNSRTRQNNTFKSQILAQGGYPESPRHASKDRYHPKKTLVSSITRTSFQDSNIFGYKSNEHLTIQPGETVPQRTSRVRDNSTFQSNVFSPIKDLRPKSRSRVESKWSSTIFEAPLEGVPERMRKTTIRQNDAGTEGIFGSQKAEF